MNYPAYVTNESLSINTTTKCAVLQRAPYLIVVPYDNLDFVGRVDLDALVAANGGVLPLTSMSVASNLLLTGGSSWYSTYLGSIRQYVEVVPAGGSSSISGDVEVKNDTGVPLSVSSNITASDNVTFNLDSLAQSLVYNVDGTLDYIQVVSGGNTYRQTFTYTSGVVTGISAWTKQ